MYICTLPIRHPEIPACVDWPALKDVDENVEEKVENDGDSNYQEDSSQPRHRENSEVQNNN